MNNDHEPLIVFCCSLFYLYLWFYVDTGYFHMWLLLPFFSHTVAPSLVMTSDFQSAWLTMQTLSLLTSTALWQVHNHNQKNTEDCRLNHWNSSKILKSFSVNFIKIICYISCTIWNQIIPLLCKMQMLADTEQKIIKILIFFISVTMILVEYI